MTTDQTPFRQAFEILQRNAQRLENDSDIDVDQLSDLIEESVKAYQICQARIHAVECALQNSLDIADK